MKGMGRTPVLEEMQAWFARNMPNVKTHIQAQERQYVLRMTPHWKEIAANKGTAIIGVAG
jgi:hypothetical protein